MYPGSSTGQPDGDFEIRWRNYQSAIARITMTGFSDCGFLSALRDILPAGEQYPSLKFRAVSKPERIGGRVQAAAQWVIRSGEARYVFSQCKEERTDGKNLRAIWSMKHWDIWKAQFQLIAGDPRVSSWARDIAKAAFGRMKATELENGTGSSLRS